MSFYMRQTRYSLLTARWKNAIKLYTNPQANNITKRTGTVIQFIPTSSPCTDLKSSNLKSKRFFRDICRLLPFLIRVHQMPDLTTPAQSKTYVANFFRQHANQIDLGKIDRLIDGGYQMLYGYQIHTYEKGQMFKFILPKNRENRSVGINKYYSHYKYRVDNKNNSKFLSSFYKGNQLVLQED